MKACKREIKTVLNANNMVSTFGSHCASTKTALQRKENGMIEPERLSQMGINFSFLAIYALGGVPLLLLGRFDHAESPIIVSYQSFDNWRISLGEYYNDIPQYRPMINLSRS